MNLLAETEAQRKTIQDAGWTPPTYQQLLEWEELARLEALEKAKALVAKPVDVCILGEAPLRFKMSYGPDGDVRLSRA
tara:strand:+ start:1098 stop:1331 length:234 start_codon:yes stop_codon:yes gene_type:complete